MSSMSSLYTGKRDRPRGLDGGQNGAVIRPEGQRDHIGAVDHHVVRRHAVELENVLDEFLFVLFNGAGLLALLHHGHDLVGQLLALVPVQPGKGWGGGAEAAD